MERQRSSPVSSSYYHLLSPKSLLLSLACTSLLLSFLFAVRDGRMLHLPFATAPLEADVSSAVAQARGGDSSAGSMSVEVKEAALGRWVASGGSAAEVKERLRKDLDLERPSSAEGRNLSKETLDSATQTQLHVRNVSAPHEAAAFAEKLGERLLCDLSISPWKLQFLLWGLEANYYKMAVSMINVFPLFMRPMLPNKGGGGNGKAQVNQQCNTIQEQLPLTKKRLRAKWISGEVMLHIVIFMTGVEYLTRAIHSTRAMHARS